MIDIFSSCFAIKNVEAKLSQPPISPIFLRPSLPPPYTHTPASIGFCSFCADSQEHALRILELGGQWMLPHGCRVCSQSPADAGSLAQLLLAAGYVTHMAESAACMVAPVEDEPCAGISSIHALLVAAVADEGAFRSRR